MWCSVPPETPHENDSSRIIPAGLVVLHIHAVRHMNSLLCCTQRSNYIQNLTWTIYCPEFCHMKHRSWTESSKTTVLRFMSIFPIVKKYFHSWRIRVFIQMKEGSIKTPVFLFIFGGVFRLQRWRLQGLLGQKNAVHQNRFLEDAS